MLVRFNNIGNMYLQMAINFGIAGMIAFLWMIICGLVLAIKSNRGETIHFLTASVFIGIVAFLVAALLNDSSISVMPMFYGLFGSSCAIAIKND